MRNADLLMKNYLFESINNYQYQKEGALVDFLKSNMDKMPNNAPFKKWIQNSKEEQVIKIFRQAIKNDINAGKDFKKMMEPLNITIPKELRNGLVDAVKNEIKEMGINVSDDFYGALKTNPKIITKPVKTKDPIITNHTSTKPEPVKSTPPVTKKAKAGIFASIWTFIKEISAGVYKSIIKLFKFIDDVFVEGFIKMLPSAIGNPLLKFYTNIKDFVKQFKKNMGILFSGGITIVGLGLLYLSSRSKRESNINVISARAYMVEGLGDIWSWIKETISSLLTKIISIASTSSFMFIMGIIFVVVGISGLIYNFTLESKKVAA